MKSRKHQLLVCASLLYAATAWGNSFEGREAAHDEGRCSGRKPGVGCDEAPPRLAQANAPNGAAPAAKAREEKERAAKKACLTGDAAAGVAILTDLYLDTNDPTHLFNQGRCFEYNRRYEDAIGRFREYLEKSKRLSPADRADTERHIANCKSYLQETRAESGATEATEPDTSSAAATPGKEETPAGEIATTPLPAAEHPGRGLRLAGGVMASVGVAGLVTGVVLNVKVNSMSSDLENNWRPSENSTRESYKTAGWIAYGAGAACVVTGVVLYYIGRRRGDQAAAITVVPTAGPAMAGTALLGRF